MTHNQSNGHMHKVDTRTKRGRQKMKNKAMCSVVIEINKY